MVVLLRRHTKFMLILFAKNKKGMVYPIEIKNPFSDNYGSKKRFKLQQTIEVVKSITITVSDKKTLEDLIALLPGGAITFDLCQMSLLLNNGNDEVIIDATCQYSLFQRVEDLKNIQTGRKEALINKQKVYLNKKVIKNAEHYAIFKWNEDIAEFSSVPDINVGNLINYLRSDNFKLILYIEAA